MAETRADWLRYLRELNTTGRVVIRDINLTTEEREELRNSERPVQGLLGALSKLPGAGVR